MKTLVLLSGGLDSTVLAAHLLADGHEVWAISFNYGQRHIRETFAAIKVAEALGIPHTLAALPSLAGLLGGSSQTDRSIPVPQGHYEDESMRLTVVPNRNMILLAIAAGSAIAQGCDAIALCNHAGDHAVYPDCRPEFIEAMRRSLAVCHYSPIDLLAPFTAMRKQDIVIRGSQINAPMHLTRSCYEDRDRHCGRCGTCVERREAFMLAEIPDPTEYDPA